jgi:uncharacterized coiled-coil DUF342 family protein
MPHLLLSFAAEQDHSETYRERGNLKPPGREKIYFKVIDTDKGSVVEMSAEAFNVRQEERPPTHAELHTASQVLGKEPGENIALKQYEELKTERDSYRQKHTSALSTIATQKNIISSNESKIRKLEAEVVAPDEKKVVAAALDGHILQMAAEGNFEAYEEAKKLYRKMSGESWVDDDD